MTVTFKPIPIDIDYDQVAIFRDKGPDNLHLRLYRQGVEVCSFDINLPQGHAATVHTTGTLKGELK